MEMAMLTKTKIALAAALLLGAASAAQAGSKDDPESTSGSHIGPMGQFFGTPSARTTSPRWRLYQRRTGINAYAFVPGYRHSYVAV
jgi:Spy/CpxP family protein refolding chaperone